MKLVIELDREVHNDFETKEKDEGRTYELEQLGITIIRFTNDEVISNIKNVLREINEIANNLKN
jgi:very-short-patch-repair endonuclease